MSHPTHRSTTATLAAVLAAAFAGAAPAAAQDEPRLLGEPAAQRIEITGGGPVIQILPGRAPFGDRALRFLRSLPGEMPQEKMQQMRQLARMGPFSNNVAAISGDFRGTFVDRGMRGDEVSGTATFTTRDGTEWRVVLTGVAPEGEPPMEPHWGGVATHRRIHGTSGNHNPFVPRVNAIAMWGTADVFRGGQKVKENAPIHIMLTSHTRGAAPNFHYQCYDCVGRPMDELHLILVPGGDTEPYEAPGGFLHVMWESSSSQVRPAG